MKKTICILIALVLATTLVCLSVSAVNDSSDYTNMTTDGQYNPSDSYTVDANVPTCEEAIVGCGGSLDNTQTIYFQLPKEDPSTPEKNWTNEFNVLPGTDYCQVCVYWWSGIGKEWPNGEGVKWVGYRATLVDANNRIYRAVVPYSGTPLVVWNNGVNGGMPADEKPSFLYARQLADVNIEGIYEDEAEPDDSLPEGTPDEDSADGCISIIDYSVSTINPLTEIPSYGSNLYVYYGDGCYGRYSEESDNFVSVEENCCNPEHFNEAGEHVGYHEDTDPTEEPTEEPTEAPTEAPTEDFDGYFLGDADNNAAVESIDAVYVMRYDAMIDIGSVEETIWQADVDDTGDIDIVDATLIQRYLADMTVKFPIGTKIPYILPA